MGVKNGTWRWTSATPKMYSSSEGVRRYFCVTCGSPVAYEADRHPGEIHFYASLLQDHTAFQSDRHFHWDERVVWLSFEDDLPKNQESS